jgi:hypothetical protein
MAARTLPGYTVLMAKDKAQVTISSTIKPSPQEHEVSAAWILARHYNCAVEFLKPLDGYRRKTPDFVMMALEWEHKSPTGNSKTTVSNNLITAKLQSPNIVFNTRRTKLDDDRIKKELRKHLVKRRSIYRIIMIAKDRKVVEIKK